MIYRLKEKRVGHQKQLDEIQHLLENNLEISEKDRQYLKNQFDILEKKDLEEKSVFCARCTRKLGFTKYGPCDYLGHNGKLCYDCFSFVNKNHASYSGQYVLGTLNIKSDANVSLHLINFDEGKIIITSKNDSYAFPIITLKSYEILDSKSKTLSLVFEDKSIENRILLTLKNVEKVIDRIYDLKINWSQLKKVSDVNKVEQNSQPSNENFEIKHGQIIKETSNGSYYDETNLNPVTFADMIDDEYNTEESKKSHQPLGIPTKVDDPVNIIKLRLARGEISKEEFEELRKMLEL